MDAISGAQHDQLRRWICGRCHDRPSRNIRASVPQKSPNPNYLSAARAFAGIGLLNVPAIAGIQVLKRIRALQAPQRWATWSSETFLRRRLAWLVRITGSTEAVVGVVSRNAFSEDLAQWLSVLSFGTDSLSSHQYWAILTGSFVHFELQHFFANMCGLYTAASTCCHIPGMNAWHVCAVTLGSSIMATLSMLMQFRLAPPPFSSSSARKTGIGASGVVSAFTALAVMGNPTKHADLIPFLPGLLTTPNWCLAALQFGGDICGLLVALSIVRAPADFPKNVGHAAHLGGALVGVLYYITALAPRRRAVGVQMASEPVVGTHRQLSDTEEIASPPHSVQNTSLAS